MRISILSTLFAVLFLATPYQTFAATILLDYSETSYSPNITGTFTLPSDVGDISSADFTIRVAGRRYSENSSGYGWYYDNNSDLIIGAQQVWSGYSVSGVFSEYTFSLEQAALDILNASKEISFALVGEDAYWSSDYGSQGIRRSTNYLDWAQLTVTPAATPVPGAVWLLSSGIAGLVFVRRKKA